MKPTQDTFAPAVKKEQARQFIAKTGKGIAIGLIDLILIGAIIATMQSLGASATIPEKQLQELQNQRNQVEIQMMYDRQAKESAERVYTEAQNKLFQSTQSGALLDADINAMISGDTIPEVGK